MGEFAQRVVYGCSQNPTEYPTLLALSQMHSIGWLAWSWGSVGNSDCASDGSFNMTADGTYAEISVPVTRLHLLTPAGEAAPRDPRAGDSSFAAMLSGQV